VVWPLLVVYTLSYLSHYYYMFLCLFVLLFFKRANTLGALVPLCLLLTFNIAALVTQSFRPSPIVFYTLVNSYLFLCLASMLGFELYWSLFRRGQAKVRSAPTKKKPSSLSRAKRRR
jgi:peptidoglycan/LPS O-acetylase OafA/YrhL